MLRRLMPSTSAVAVLLPAFAANVRAHLAAGLHGVVVTGSTGEAALLDEDERAHLVDLARDATPHDRTLLVGTGAESTRAVIARNRMAAERGADGVLVVAPHYYGDAMTADALRDHYERIADASPVPVLLYTIPKYMHFAVPNTSGWRKGDYRADVSVNGQKVDTERFSIVDRDKADKHG